MGLRALRAIVPAWTPAGAGGVADLLGAVAARWTELVGERIAARSQPLSVEGEALVVATGSSAWSEQLQLLEPQILARIEALVGPGVRKLRFRSGALRRRTPPASASARSVTAQRRDPLETQSAPDSATALERVRRRIAAAVRAAGGRCAECGAPTASPGGCAPCRGERGRQRRLELERLLYAAPWLDGTEIAAILPEVRRDEFLRIRRDLLHRWGTTLGRLRRAGREASIRERQIASSYVLLQSGLAPEDVSPAVMRNVLGEELEALLYGGPGSAVSTANEKSR